MIAREAADELPGEIEAVGWKPGKKKGWKGLTKGHVVTYRPNASKELWIAVVLYNDRSNMSIEAHSPMFGTSRNIGRVMPKGAKSCSNPPRNRYDVSSNTMPWLRLSSSWWMEG